MELKLLDTNPTRLADRILLEAVERRASDIHVEALERETRVRLRIDGLLQELFTLPLTRHGGLISRFKIMGGMDIGVQRIPQDGRWQVNIGAARLDLRLSTLPGIYGEKLVVRVLESSLKPLQLEQLSFSRGNWQLYKSLYHQPNGLILVTGPTGSGKSTTLYATLAQLNQGELNITTLEDPVEYVLPGATQVAVNEKAGLTFSSGLRAIVRQDPDIIMVGEIRDDTTAEMAIQAALTGHLVFSTLHTNSAVGSINRLLDMGIAPFLVASALKGVLAQRLVRRLCPKCKALEPTNMLEQSCLQSYGLEPPKHIYHSVGCEHCNYTGYFGRVALQEVLPINEVLARQIIEGCSEEEKLAYGKTLGLVPLAQDGLEKLLLGLTSVEELLRTGVLKEGEHAL